MLKTLFVRLGRWRRSGTPTTPAHPLPTSVRAQLAELDQVKAKLANMETEQQRLATEAEEARRTRKEAEFNRLAATLLQEGIPQTMIDQVKPLLITETGAVVGKIKLSSGAEQDATQTDLIVQSLRALPDFLRTKPVNVPYNP